MFEELGIWNLNHKFFELFAENIADVSIPEGPPSPMSASVSIHDTPPPLKNADVLYGRPLLVLKSMDANSILLA